MAYSKRPDGSESIPPLCYKRTPTLAFLSSFSGLTDHPRGSEDFSRIGGVINEGRTIWKAGGMDGKPETGGHTALDHLVIVSGTACKAPVIALYPPLRTQTWTASDEKQYITCWSQDQIGSTQMVFTNTKAAGDIIGMAAFQYCALERKSWMYYHIGRVVFNPIEVKAVAAGDNGNKTVTVINTQLPQLAEAMRQPATAFTHIGDSGHLWHP
ncbi:hypothetical protein CPB86DRAFT_802678 [Serendipita vermifera]|nr:hypothetical protein CPB86DRAFT_802678 [Serendipita vermifera]